MTLIKLQKFYAFFLKALNEAIFKLVAKLIKIISLVFKLFWFRTFCK